MTIPQWAVQAAIKGGWRTDDEDLRDVIDLDWEDFYWQKAVLDPDFWQCLGKELGWKKYQCKCSHYYNKEGFVKCPECKKEGAHYTWKLKAFALYDLILSRATDEEIAAYWDSLKPKV